MSSASDNLERYFKSFTNETGQFEFFTGLADYINYVLETPILKEIVNETMKKKEEEYEKLTLLETQTLQELQKAKKKLIKIIKDYQISPNSLQHITTLFPGVSDSVLDSLEQFENGKIWVSGFHSDSLENYLFDIAVGISKQKPDLIKEFIVPNKPSNNTNSDFLFSFSQTIDARREQTKLIDHIRKLEIWGVFDNLLKFQKAFAEECKNTHYSKVIEKYGSQSQNYLDGRDAVDITFATQDIQKITSMKYGRVLDNNLSYLKLPNFKLYASRAQTYLLKELSKNEKEKVEEKLFTENDEQNREPNYLIRKSGGIYYTTDREISFENKEAIYFKVFDILFEKRDGDGFCSYETINLWLEKSGEEHIENKAKMIERISNGLKNLDRYSNLPQTTPDGKDVIKTRRGQGLVLHNPLLN